MKTLAANLIVLLLSLSGVSRSEQVAAMVSEYVVIRPVVNMYSLPSRDSDVISQAIYGSNVRLLESKGEWARIQTADQYTGWAPIAMLRAAQGRSYARAGQVVRVTQLSANIYRDPDVTKHEPMLTAPWESRLEVIADKVAEGERWLKVHLPDDREGYVQRGDVSLDLKPVDIPTSIAIARRFLGVTYTWGGTSALGYDCSGFMQMIMRQRGIPIPRDADQQAAWSGFAAVERKDLKPGDLLYFGPAPDKVTHTGMYIGDGQFIHDTTHEHPMVQISRLDDEPWTRLLVAARRAKE